MDKVESCPEQVGVLTEFSTQHGPTAFLLVIVSVMFWRLIWKVWHAAMQSKDDEIKRLTTERDKYQRLVFKDLLSSNQKAPTNGTENSDESGKAT